MHTRSLILKTKMRENLTKVFFTIQEIMKELIWNVFSKKFQLSMIFYFTN